MEEVRQKRKYTKKSSMIRDLDDIPSINKVIEISPEPIEEIRVLTEDIKIQEPIKRLEIISVEQSTGHIDNIIPICYDTETKALQILDWDILSKIDKEWLRIREEESFQTCGSRCYNFTYLKNGLFGEIGELYDLVKRVIRGDYTENNIFDYNTFKHKFIMELGDVLWYVAVLNRLFSLHEIKDSCLNVSFDCLQETDSLMINNNIHNLLDVLHIHAIIFINTHQVDSVILIIDAIAKLYSSNIEEVGRLNYEKLQKRVANNQLKGSGSDR